MAIMLQGKTLPHVENKAVYRTALATPGLLIIAENWLGNWQGQKLTFL